MPFQYTWDATFESLPDDNSYGYTIDDYFRQLYIAIRERMQVDHIWKNGQLDGAHNKSSYAYQSAKPTAANGYGHVYTKDVGSGVIELFYEDESGNEIQLTNAFIPLGKQAAKPTATALFGFVYTKDVGSGVIELFYEDASGNEIQLTTGGVINAVGTSFSQVYCIASGTGTTADPYVATLSPARTSYVTGAHYFIKFTSENTVDNKININALGVKVIKNSVGNDMFPGDIPAGFSGILKYDGTNLILLNSPNVNRIGELVQVQRTDNHTLVTTTSSIPFDDTIPQNTEGVEFFTCTITPRSSSNILNIDVYIQCCPDANYSTSIAALFKDSISNALSSCVCDRTWGGNGMQCMSLHYSVVAGTTSAITFKVRIGTAGAGTLTVNGSFGASKLGGVLNSCIIIQEVRA